MKKLILSILIALSVILALALFLVSCQKNKGISINLNGESTLLESKEYVLDVIELEENSQTTVEDIPFAIFENKKEITKDNLTIKYFKVVEDSATLLEKDALLETGEYLINVKYGDINFSIKAFVNKKGPKQVILSINKNSLVWSDQKIAISASEEDVEYRYIEKTQYDFMQDKSLNNIKAKSSVYNSNIKIDVGEYYLFAVYKNTLSNFVYFEINPEKLSIIEGDNASFNLLGGIPMEYREGIYLKDITFTPFDYQVVDKNCNPVVGRFEWKNKNEIIDCATIGAIIQFIPDNKNYDIVEKFVQFDNLILKKVIAKPTFIELNQTYTGSEFNFMFENKEEIDLYEIKRDNKIIDINDGDNVIQKIIDAKDYIYEVVVKDKRNYVWQGGSSSFNVTCKINPAQYTISPTQITIQVDENNNAKFIISTKEGEGQILVSKYIIYSLKCIMLEDQDGSVSVESVESKWLIDEKCDEVTLKNVQFNEDFTEYTYELKITTKGLNFTDMEEIITIKLTRA